MKICEWFDYKSITECYTAYGLLLYSDAKFIKKHTFFRFSQQEIEAKVTSFRNLLLVRQATATAAAVHGAQGLQAVTNPAAAALAAITAAAQLASQHHGGGHRGVSGGPNQHQLATALRTTAAAASLASSVANAANAFTQKPSNAILNLRLNQQLHQQRLSNAILTGQMPSGSTYR